MISAPPFLVSALLEDSGVVRHRFYGRRGGVSVGSFASLNCSGFCGDLPNSVDDNRHRVADCLGGVRVFTNKQVHGSRVRILGADADADETFDGDGMVTDDSGLCLGVLTADCAPILFADPAAAVIGVAHAGWRGALSGITDAVVAAMTGLGAVPAKILCAIGPTIQANSYRVGQEFVARFQSDSAVQCGDCFTHTPTNDQSGDGDYYFDLPNYLRKRIRQTGITKIDTLPNDTFTDEEQFFSYRRSCQQRKRNTKQNTAQESAQKTAQDAKQETILGRQLSAIVLP